MTDVVQRAAPPPRSLAERVRAQLGVTSAVGVREGEGEDATLLLDCSGSMAEWCGPGRSKITALIDIAAGLLGSCRVVAFNDRCWPVRGVAELRSLAPSGGTFLGAALAEQVRGGATHVVLVTDGLPQDPDEAIRAARSLRRLDIFYVGPAPAPPFLAKLAQAAAQGGSAQAANLGQAGARQLRTAIAGLLSAPQERRG